MKAGQTKSSLAPNGCEAAPLKLRVPCWSELERNGVSLQLRAEVSRPAASPSGNESNIAASRPGQRAIDKGYTTPGQPHLTRRELQVLRLIAAGHHNPRIARAIHRSIKTVEKHRQNLNKKLRIHDTAGLTRYAISSGISTTETIRSAARQAVHLTPRETQVLRLLAQGLPNKGIADELHRSINTVENHRERMMSKLGLHEIASLTRYAVSVGLVAAAVKSF